MNKYTVKYNYKDVFLHIEVYGQIQYDNYLDIIEYLLSPNFIHSYNLYLLLDVRKTQITMNINDTKKLIKFFSETISKFKNIRFAELVTTPKETAYRMIFKSLTSHLTNLKYEVFCTDEAATFWLFKSKSELANLSIVEYVTEI